MQKQILEIFFVSEIISSEDVAINGLYSEEIIFHGQYIG